MTEENNQLLQNNNRNFNNVSALQLRLNTQPLLDQLELFLKGERTILEEENGKIVVKKLKVGQQKVNDRGVQSLMSYISSMINPSVVQGNLDIEQYDRIVYRCRLEITQDIVTNRGNYNIDGDNLNLIIDFCMNLIEPFLSRLIDNKERESYVDTLKTIESSRLETNKNQGLFGKSS